MSEANEYRQWAEECKLTAKRAVRREEAFWLRWAEDWTKLAEERENCETIVPSDESTVSIRSRGTSGKTTAYRPLRAMAQDAGQRDATVCR
jgi:hypothetical protein